MRLEWTVTPLGQLAARLTRLQPADRPAVLAVTGHSSSGKTTLARRLVAALPSAGLLHTDDLAWHHGVFAWDELLLRDVLPVVRAGEPLRYRPPGWVQRGRPGTVELPGALSFLVVEGVGASQPSVRAAYDFVIWVETDEPTRLERDAVRVSAGEISPVDYASWMAEEDAHIVATQPWRDADLLVYGGESIDHDRASEVVLRDSSATVPRQTPPRPQTNR